MTEEEVRAPRLHEKTIFLLACGGILLLLGLMLGIVMSKRGANEADDVQSGMSQGFEHAVVVEGLAPRIVPVDADFVVRASVINVGVETLRDIQLTIGADKLIMPVPAGTMPTLNVDVLPPNHSKTFEARFRAIEPGETSIAAHAKDSTQRIASGRYWDLEVTKEAVKDPQYLPGALMALRISTFGPTTIDPQRPFEVVTILENSGQLALAELTLNIRTGDGLQSASREQLDYPIESLAPGESRRVRARFKMNGAVARGQIHVYATDKAGWAAGIGLHTVTTRP